MNTQSLLGWICVLLIMAVTCEAAHVTLVDNGHAMACIVVSPEVLACDPDSKETDDDLRLLRWAADDLAHYLGQISGSTLTTGESPKAGQIAIYVGASPEPVAMSASSMFGDAYMIDISPERIILSGESSRSVYYAAAQLLHQLGVRWYAPEAAGEYVPHRASLELPVGRIESSPDFHTRNLWASNPSNRRWALRNRLGGPAMPQGHAFYRHMKRGTLRESHPEYYPIVNGEVDRLQANMSNPEVVDLFVESIRAEMRSGTHWADGGSSIAPDDGLVLDERPASLAMDSGRIDPLFQVRSATDRLVKFGNAIAEQLEGEFGDRSLGFHVYANHQLPPQTVKPHPMLLPIIAPIGYNRYTSIGSPTGRTAMMLAGNVQAWREASERVGCYLYNYNLADTAMPFTRTLYWQLTLPRLYEWGVRYVSVESMQDNWHNLVPGNYVLAQLLWDIDADVDAILDEFYATYYGPAADAMRSYDRTIEQAYETTSAYAGGLWSTHRILTPTVMQQLQTALAQAEAQATAAEDARIAERVAMRRFTLNFAEAWLGARQAINSGDFDKASAIAATFEDNRDAAQQAYPLYFGQYIQRYWNIFHGRSFADAGRIAREGSVVYRLPDEWTVFLDANKVGFDDQIYSPAASTDGWTTLRTYSASLDEQGLPFFRGVLWYRHDFELPEHARTAKTLRLWLGGIDDTAHVYLNGRSLGKIAPGNFGSGEVDLTDAIIRQGMNTLVIGVDNSSITELGTGGLVRPAVIYVPAATAAPSRMHAE